MECLDCFVSKPCPSWKGVTHMVEQQPVLEQQGAQQQIQKHQSFSESRVALRTCKPTPLKVSRAEMMQEQKQPTRTLHLHICASTHPCRRAHTCTQTCVQRCTRKKHTYVRLGTCTRSFIHTYVNAYPHNCTHPRTHTVIEKNV